MRVTGQINRASNRNILAERSINMCGGSSVVSACGPVIVDGLDSGRFMELFVLSAFSILEKFLLY